LRSNPEDLIRDSNSNKATWLTAGVSQGHKKRSNKATRIFYFLKNARGECMELQNRGGVASKGDNGSLQKAAR
jgi:hypothetical protein